MAVAGSRDADPAVARLRWRGSATAPEVKGLRPAEVTAAYFVGDDPSAWHPRVPRYAAVEYAGVYPGIDLIFSYGAGGLEYDFVVAPGADPEAIQLELAGGRAELDPEGNLRLAFEATEMVHRAPEVFQEVAGERLTVQGSFRLRAAGGIGFELGAWDRALPLVIDPKIQFSTYLGGSDHDVGIEVARDSSGRLFVLGRTESPRIAGVGRQRAGTSEMVIARFDKRGRLERLAYLGGDEGATPGAMAIGNVSGPGSPEAVFVAGSAGSGFPTALPIQEECARRGSGPCPFSDATITVLDLDLGSLLFSTYLGGTDGDAASPGGSLAVDHRGRIAVVGITISKDFPTRRPTQKKLLGLHDGFVAVLEPLTAGGYRLAFSTYLGGRKKSSRTSTEGVAFDGDGHLHVVGDTNAKRKFPTVGAIQKSLAGEFDGFLTVYDLDAGGAPAILFSTYFGGKGHDGFNDVVVDGTGRSYVTGSTSSADYPVVHPLDGTLGGPSDALVTVFDVVPSKMSGGEPEVVMSTLFGGSAAEDSLALAVDRAGLVHFGGITSSRDLPVRLPVQPQCAAHPRLTPDCFDAFVARLGPVVAGQVPALRFSTFLGGPEFADLVRSVAVDPQGATYVTGATPSTGFPTRRAGQKRNLGGNDVFVTKIKK